MRPHSALGERRPRAASPSRLSCLPRARVCRYLDRPLLPWELKTLTHLARDAAGMRATRAHALLARHAEIARTRAQADSLRAATRLALRAAGLDGDAPGGECGNGINGEGDGAEATAAAVDTLARALAEVCRPAPRPCFVERSDIQRRIARDESKRCVAPGGNQRVLRQLRL